MFGQEWSSTIKDWKNKFYSSSTNNLSNSSAKSNTHLPTKWSCDRCTFSQSATSPHCAMCYNPNPLIFTNPPSKQPLSVPKIQTRQSTPNINRVSPTVNRTSSNQLTNNGMSNV